MNLTNKEKQKKLFGLFLIIFTVSLSLLIAVSATFFNTQTRISIDQKIELDKVLSRDKKIEIIFFGYTGCIDICTPRLHYLSDMYKKFSKELQQKVDVVFIDISNPVEESLPDQFAKSFHKDFIGEYLHEKNVRNYTRAFSVYFSKSLFDETEYNHTTNLYIVTKKDERKSIRYVYNTYPYDVDTIIQDIQGLIDE